MTKLEAIYHCVEYLQENRYYGDFEMSYALGDTNAEDYICSHFTTKDGDEVSHDVYLVVKDILEEAN